MNDELTEIYKALNSLQNVLVNDSIIVTISFHSLEDRIVKQWGKNNKQVIQINDKIIKPSIKEIKSNPRSRSAILRAYRYNNP